MLPLCAGADLNSGYQSMYDLDFATAHQTFATFSRANLDEPMGPVSNAAAYLFSELERLHVLDSELLVDDDKFHTRHHLSADPSVKKAFEQELALSRQRVQTKPPDDRNALLADVLAHGLEADYLSWIDHRDLAALSVVKEGRAKALHLSMKPAPVRWVLSWGGAQTSKTEGIAKLRLTAENGYLLKPYTRTLLAVAVLRDNDHAQATQLLEGLVREFPNNRLYAAELARVKRSK